MVESNRSADEQSQFGGAMKGALVGGAIAGAKELAVDLPIHMMLKKDTSKMKDGKPKELLQSMQKSHNEMAAQFKPYNWVTNTLSGRASMLGLAVATGMIAGAAVGKE